MIELLGNPINKKSNKPAHIQVREKLLQLILDGTFSPGCKIPAEPILAARLGVSRMTANKSILALATDGWLVRSKGRGTFVAQNLPNDLEGNESTLLTRRILVATDLDLTDSTNSIYFGSLFWRIHKYFQSAGYIVDFISLDEGLLQKTSQARAVIVLAPPTQFQMMLRSIANKFTPTVLLGSNWTGFPVSQVDCDNRLGSSLAVNHLVDLGHKRILFMGSGKPFTIAQERLKGFQSACKSRGLAFEDRLVWENIDDESMDRDHRLRLEGILKAKDAPTAIFIDGARLALRTLSCVQSLGLTCPEDISIVGYDDPEFLSLANPAITTVRQPIEEMTQVTCAALQDLMEGRLDSPFVASIDPELIIRGSTAKSTD